MNEKMTRHDFMSQRLNWNPVASPRKFIGGDVFFELDDARRAIVSLETHGTAEHYVRLLVRIVNKFTGEIDRKFFAFSEFLRGRIDDRVGGPHPWPTNNREENAEFTRFEVTAYCGWDWYIAVPADTTTLTEAVASYIAQFV